MQIRSRDFDSSKWRILLSEILLSGAHATDLSSRRKNVAQRTESNASFSARVVTLLRLMEVRFKEVRVNLKK